jgi:hypothetical protein
MMAVMRGSRKASYRLPGAISSKRLNGKRPRSKERGPARNGDLDYRS